jgi:potassium efflux system protein
MHRAVPLLAVAAMAVVLLTMLPSIWGDADDVRAELGITSASGTPELGPTFAEDGSPDYDDWRGEAARARSVIARALASSASFEALRGQLADWRDVFDAEAARYVSPVNVLDLQISALGPAPASDETEPEAIAARRADLESQLQALRVPLLLAEVAAAEASGYVTEIDDILRNRRSAELVTRGPSILNPANWTAAIGELTGMLSRAGDDFATSWNNRLMYELRVQRAPAIALMVILGTVMMISGGRLLARVTPGLSSRVPQNETAAELRWILAQTGRLLVRLLGLLLVVGAIDLLELYGSRASGPVQTLGAIGSVLLVARWLAVSLFGKSDEAPRLFRFTAARRGVLRRSVLWLGVALAVGIAVKLISNAPGGDSDFVEMLDVPLLVVAGFLLLRQGRLLREDTDAIEAVATEEADQLEAGEDRLRARALGITSAFVRLAGVAAPVLAIAGYYDAADLLVYATIGSLALAGGLLLLQRVVVGALSLALERRGAELGGAAGLVPILFGFALVVLALPLFALVWGVRGAVLVDIWRSLRNGITVGGVTFTLENIAVFFIVFVVGYILTGLAKGALSSTILPRTKLDIGARDALATGAGYIGIILTVILAVTMAGIDLTGLAFVAGALSVGIGFGLRTIVENFVSGIILLVERPIKQGDWIDVGGTMGYVREISVRSTRIETFDRSDVVVPNADLITGKVTNYTYNSLVGRLIVPVGVAYGSDVEKVRSILLEVGEANPMVVRVPPPSVVFQGFGESSLDFELRVILRDVNYTLSVRTEINTEINRRFNEAGIEIPFPQRDLWVRNPGDLRPAAAGPVPGAAAAAAPRPEDWGQLPVPDDAPYDAPDDPEGDNR